ncbi:unnamed protein product [Rotaria sp. Silwood1]|nr:unnamed protein product [Rotaria sp. Silwood1]CAF1282555.1 unnamed protein product [Rotaria sp. Silwood1]CAF3513798.1 unnamed protein product [Rotaria sp. Silwood1]CAF4939865.1 unnamed protein product [Rotaria sp. Silwood1]
MERKKKDMIEKLKSGEFIAIVEPPSSSHGSFWEHLLRIKCLNNEYQPFVQCRLCYEILSYIPYQMELLQLAIMLKTVWLNQIH